MNKSELKKLKELLTKFQEHNEKQYQSESIKYSIDTILVNIKTREYI